MASISTTGIRRGQQPSATRRLHVPAVIEGSALVIVCFALLSLLIFATPGLLGNDDYYHARISDEIIVQGRLAVDFPWLPKTILSPEQFVDHHLLYHVYLAPWVHFDGMSGAKLGQVVIAAAVFLAVWVVLRQVGVRWSALWTLALFALSSPFLFRLLMIRTQGASVLLLLIALSILFARRYRWLIPLSFAYAWLYDGFVLMPAFALLYTISEWLSDRRLDWRPVVYSTVGIVLGLIINPYFPRNILFIAEHLGAKVDFESGVQVGSEWYPYTTAALLLHSGGALLVLVVGFLRSSFDGRKRDRIENTLLLVALLTLFMLFRSRRFIEYYPPFALLFCAVVWRVRSPLRLSQIVPARLVAIVPIGLLSVTTLFGGATFMDARQTIQSSDDPRWFVGASEWLATHTPKGTPVFQTDWDDFTRLFYYNTANTYLVGLDPTYLERADPRLWNRWVAITRGEVEQPSNMIRTVFGSEYVVSDRQHSAFEDRAYGDPNMKLVYWDKNSMVWQIVSVSTQT
jgi:hypothetical protein